MGMSIPLNVRAPFPFQSDRAEAAPNSRGSIKRDDRGGTWQRRAGCSYIDNEGDHKMGSTSDKAAGMANEAIGNAKQGVGKVVGSDKMQAEGKAQEVKGEVQQATGKAKETVKDGANAVADSVNRKL
jgi:uncharacterized protein YjbJ (UPF0337 family)